MHRKFIDSKEFIGKNFTELGMVFGDYEYCSFINCDFSSVNLSDFGFTECEFEDSNLSTVQLVGTTFNDVKFKNCKLLGIQFDKCNKMLFSINFETCQLNLSSFYQLELKNTKFKDCNLQEVDFVESDLTGINFINCDLKGAMFENTILRKANFKSAYNYSFDPEVNRITKAKFSSDGISGLLEKYDIEIS